MPEERSRVLEPAKRVRTFQEVYLGLSRTEAIENAKLYLERERSVKGDSCPLGTDLFGVLRSVAKGDLTSALETVLEQNPLPGVTGRLAPEPYFETQILNKNGERISLRAMERFLGDHARLKKAEAAAAFRAGRKIAVIGSGPAGLTAAFFLTRAGHRVTVLESSHILGGTLSYAYPEFRLPSKAVDVSIDSYREAGVEFVSNTLFGRDVILSELFDQGFVAVLLACGAGIPGSSGLSGESAAGVIPAEELLKARHWMKAGIELYGTPFEIGKKVLVIGVGERAFDCARILVRLGREVTILVDGSETHMAVDNAMVRQASEEGVKFRTFTRPTKILTDHTGCVKGVVCEHLDYKVDSQGKLTVVADREAEFTLEADTMITVAGTLPDTLFLRNVPGLTLESDGALCLKPETSETLVNGVFACGHLVDPSTKLLGAMISAKRAASEIDKFLNS